jgi:hypothetical protein
VLDDIKANQEAAKVIVNCHVFRNVNDKNKRKGLFKNLKKDSVWINNSRTYALTGNKFCAPF